MPIKTLFSDADGTLVDTKKLILHGQYEAAKRYLENHERIPEEAIPSYEVYERHLNEAVGGSTHETFVRTLNLLFKDQAHHLDHIDFDELDASLNPIQDELAPRYVQALPGLKEILSWLGTTGRSLAIFTSGSPHHIVRNFGIALPELGSKDLYKDKSLTDHEKLEKFTNTMQNFYKLADLAFITCEDVRRTKPDPESLIEAARRLGADLATGAVLGDHRVDMETAIAAGVQTRIGYTQGFHNGEQLLLAGATNIVTDLSQVAAILET